MGSFYSILTKIAAYFPPRSLIVMGSMNIKFSPDFTLDSGMTKHTLCGAEQRKASIDVR